MNFYRLLLIYLLLRFSNPTTVNHHNGIDIIFSDNWKLISADAYLSKNLYFFVLSQNGKSFLKNINVTQIGSGKANDILTYPVQSAESVAVDWVNGNLYWADQKNHFIEVVDLNNDLEFPISRHRRRILFSTEMADIFSVVVDPWEQYLFWLNIGAHMIIERANLDGSKRQTIHRSSLYRSSHLAIDRHRKMLFWWDMDKRIHRIDYQGQTGCSMQLDDFKIWNPTFLTFADGKLIFINDNTLWETSFTSCGPGVAVSLSLFYSHSPVAIVATKHQITVPEKKGKSLCSKKGCSSICLPSSDSQFQCVCMTGITSAGKNLNCSSFPSKSLIIGSQPKIYQMSLENSKQPLELLTENSGIPFRFAYDSIRSSLLYVDFNSSSIYSLNLNNYAEPQKLSWEYPVFSQILISIDIDSESRNIYWMNHRNSEVWVARINSNNQLKFATLLLSWLPSQLFTDPRSQLNLPPSELVVDSHNRYLFVTVMGDEFKYIERYWLDGSHKFMVLNSSKDCWPRSLTIDHQGKVLFFFDALKNEIKSINYDGSHLRVISTKFQELFGLSYFDGFIYWTELEAFSINRIKPDGSSYSMITKTRNFEARTMPIIAISRKTNNYDSPCRESVNKCEELCFPTKYNSRSYTCGCSNPANVLLNLSRCSYSSEMLIYYNASMVITHHLNQSSKQQVIVLEKETDSKISYIQLDYFRNHMYWINDASNCIMKTAINSDITRHWKIFCQSSDKISNIALDIVRNNLYASISGSVWNRIILIRLPFLYSDFTWRRTVFSSELQNRFITALAVHSEMKCLFWFESKNNNRIGIAYVYKANLDGSDSTVIWQGFADTKELVMDDHAHHVCWKNNALGKIYRYNIMTKRVETFQLASDILDKVHDRVSNWLHIYPMMNFVYIYLHETIFQLDMNRSNSSISINDLKLVLQLFNFPMMRAFSVVSRAPTSTKRLASIKTDVSSGVVVMCPTAVNNEFISCSQFCLPTSQNECACASTYSLNADKSTCTDTSDLLMAMTNAGEIIGIRINSSNEKNVELLPIESVEIPHQKLKPGQKFIDAVYWLSRNVILRLDNFGYLSAIDQMQPFILIKEYKRLNIFEEGGNLKRYTNTYEKIYKHFMEKETFKSHYISRFSLAIDPISDTLFWSDWVNGIIASERLNVERDRIDFLGVILDFRQTSRRPLQIAVAPISSSLIWISADLAHSGSNGSSIWRHFWIEMSDLDGSRHSVLVKDPGIPSCLTVDMNSGRIYWVDKLTNKVMYLYIHWNNQHVRMGQGLAYNMKATVNSLLSVRHNSSISSMVILRNNLFWRDDFQQNFASISLSSDSLRYLKYFGISTNIKYYDFKYLKSKLKEVVRILSRLAPEDFRFSSLGAVMKNHPCSRATHTLHHQPCSHFCLSTIPISLPEHYQPIIMPHQLDEKYRCACPLHMSVIYKDNGRFGNCTTNQFKCVQFQIPCKAGRVFLKNGGISAQHCLPIRNRCDSVEDCLDGSDELGCNVCNSTHSYSCSGSGSCIPLKKRCDGIIDCESDELCCSGQQFECLSGTESTRCISKSKRCDGIVDCYDGSDEQKCNANHKYSSNDDYFTIGNLSNNHTVAIIAGSIALFACSIAIIYICISRRKRMKTVHESCLFRANNVNIMFMSPSQRPFQSHRCSNPYQKPESTEDIFHAKSCDVVDNFKQCEDSDPTTQSLNSLSDCYRRIKNPQPCPCSVLGRPLFSMQDDVFFHMSQIKRRDKCTDNCNVEKITQLPPSEVTINAEELEKSENQINDDPVMVSMNSLVSSPCDSELEEIYVHRYQLMRRPSLMDNYPSCLLQNLLSACNQASQLCITPTAISKDLVVENIYRRRRRRRKLFKSRTKRNNSKANLSLSPPRRSRLHYSQNDSDFDQHSSSNPHISPPPPSPITVLSNKEECY